MDERGNRGAERERQRERGSVTERERDRNEGVKRESDCFSLLMTFFKGGTNWFINNDDDHDHTLY